MITVAISGAKHDASLCIMRNEKVILQIQEERISKIKRDSSSPFSFMKLVKDFTKDIDLLVFTDFLSQYDAEGILVYLRKNSITVKNVRFENSNHHLYHASSAFYGSGFDDAICLVIDGWGTSYSLSQGVECLETTSIYYASYPNEFDILYKNLYCPLNLFSPDINDLDLPQYCELTPSFDIGVVYGTTTNHLGFERLDAGKTMGLSSYGQEDTTLPNFSFNKTHYSDSNLILSNRRLNKKLFPQIVVSGNDFQKKANIAFKVQKYLEEVFLYRVEQAINLNPNCNNLVLSGGCALNILGNTLIKKSFPHLNIFVDPVANDACLAYGASKYHYYDETKELKKDPLELVYSGPSYSIKEMKNLVKKQVMEYNSKENFKIK